MKHAHPLGRGVNLMILAGEIFVLIKLQYNVDWKIFDIKFFMPPIGLEVNSSYMYFK